VSKSRDDNVLGVSGANRSIRTPPSESRSVITDAGFPNRIERLAEEAGSLAELARRAGISRRMVDRYRHGSVPSSDNLVALANAGGVSLQWLATGEVGHIKPAGDSTFIENGLYLTAEQHRAASISFNPRWIKEMFGANTFEISLLPVQSTEMEPTLKEGGHILVDRRVQEFRAPGIYVLRFETSNIDQSANLKPAVVLPRRVTIRPDGTLLVTVDNPEFRSSAEMELQRDQVDPLIIGQAVWVGGRL
jgi:phage repressor protein C with HTH and peptisase S24 domain